MYIICWRALTKFSAPTKISFFCIKIEFVDQKNANLTKKIHKTFVFGGEMEGKQGNFHCQISQRKKSKNVWETKTPQKMGKHKKSANYFNIKKCKKTCLDPPPECRVLLVGRSGKGGCAGVGARG